MNTPDLIEEKELPFNLIAESDEERRNSEVTAQRIEAKRREVETAGMLCGHPSLF